jgi:hypothetical protein
VMDKVAADESGCTGDEDHVERSLLSNLLCAGAIIGWLPLPAASRRRPCDNAR